MGHSQADKDESHDRIVRMAAARFREAGVDGIGVADLMQPLPSLDSLARARS